MFPWTEPSSNFPASNTFLAVIFQPLRYHCHSPYRWGNWNFQGVAGPRLTPRASPAPHCQPTRVTLWPCVRVCVRVSACVCVCTCVYVCACMYICAHVCSLWVHLCTCVCAHVSLQCAWVMCVRVDVHVCVPMGLCVLVYACSAHP